MADGKKKLGECTVGCENDVVQLVILVAGTTDPVNATISAASRAVSYDSPYRYWDAAFYDAIKKLVAGNKNAALFDMHGWSGDNREVNRNEAGSYLVNRLIGANGLVAFYGQTYQKKDIHIHLVGHSHGGNVMNEMTKQIDKLGAKWPTTWKIKSFTYLSTPFFTKLHQVKIGAFVHPKAEVLNVFNKYDMTQRVLADFSLYTLGDVLTTPGFKDLTTVALPRLIGELNKIPLDLLKDWYMSKADGAALFPATRDGLAAIRVFLVKIAELAKDLNKPMSYPEHEGMKANKKDSSASYSHKVLSDTALAALQGIIQSVNADIGKAAVSLQRSIDTANYSRLQYLKDLLQMSPHIAEFLDIPTGALSISTAGVLWRTMVGVLSDAIEVFDDTTTEPSKQFNGSRTITPKEVTDKDAYDKSVSKAIFPNLMTRIEAIETQMTAKPDATLLLDLLLTLMVHGPDMQGIATTLGSAATALNWAEVVLTGEDDARSKRLRATLSNFSQALLTRFEGNIEDATDTTPNKETGKRGSLIYLFKESHSVSRRVLHDDVKKFLQRMMG